MRAGAGSGSSEVDFLSWFLIGAGALCALYPAAWVVTRAFFDNKVDYHKRLLRQLEEK